MRSAFIRTLLRQAKVNPRIFLLVGDLGYSVIEPFAEEFPDRFVNVGVAEQNMTGLAAGLALCGKIVFTYSIANFPTLRCLEQIRNDICYHEANVKIVAVGGGFSYGALGMTHYGTEDLAIMRSLPNMTLVAPGDPVEAGLATQAIIEKPGPCYLRLNKTGEPVIHPESLDFKIGQAIMIRDGHDLTLISTGAMLQTSVQAAEQLARHGIRSRVISMHTMKPLDIEAIHAAARETSAIITVEEHSIIGGLGSAVAEVLAEQGGGVAFKRLGIKGPYLMTVGNQEYLRQVYDLTVDGIIKHVHMLIKQEVYHDL